MAHHYVYMTHVAEVREQESYTETSNAFTRKYSLEMVKDVGGTNRKWRRKNLSSTSTLTLDHVDILVYDFSLTKTVI